MNKKCSNINNKKITLLLNIPFTYQLTTFCLSENYFPSTINVIYHDQLEIKWVLSRHF